MADKKLQKYPEENMSYKTLTKEELTKLERELEAQYEQI